MKENPIQAILLWPGEHPCITYLLKDRTFLNFAVGLGSHFDGEIALLKLSDTAAILYNCALLADFRGNRKVGSKLLVGAFYIVGIENGTLTDLSSDDMALYFDRFWEPEYFTEKEVEQACFDAWFHNITAPT